MIEVNWIPLVSPKSLHEMLPQEFREYVRGLKEAKPKKSKGSALEGVSVSVNKKGSLVFRFDRPSKWLTPQEVTELARQLGLKQNKMWQEVRSRRIEICEPKAMDQVKAIPW